MGSRALLLLAVSLPLAAARADTICVNRFGRLTVRAMCRAYEHPLDPDALGLRGAPGTCTCSTSTTIVAATTTTTLASACCSGGLCRPCPTGTRCCNPLLFICAAPNEVCVQ